MSANIPETRSWRVIACPSTHPDALYLRALLSDELMAIVGDPGQGSFADWKDGDGQHRFFVGYIDGQPAACGGLRMLEPGIGEVKRMYVTEKGSGVASMMLNHLTEAARTMGFDRLRLETRVANTRAIRFYERSGFARIAPYGRYVGRSDACCMEKQL